MADEETTGGEAEPTPTGEDGSTQAPSQTAPITFTQEQADALVASAVEKATQDFRTWSGRRDKALIDQLATTIDERITQRPITGTGEPAPGEQFDFDNPAASIDKILSKREQKKQVDAQRYNDAAITGIGRYMDSDPIFKDQEFGQKVLNATLQNIGNMRRDVPPDIAAQLLVKDAVIAVGKDKIVGSKNPLDKNTGAKQPFGSESAPSGQKQKIDYNGPKLSESAAKLAAKWNYSPEDLNKLFPDKK